MRQDPEIAGNTAHLFPIPNVDDPSFLSTPVRKYLSLRLALALPKNDTRRLSELPEKGGMRTEPLLRLLKPSASVRKPWAPAPNSSVVTSTTNTSSTSSG